MPYAYFTTCVGSDPAGFLVGLILWALGWAALIAWPLAMAAVLTDRVTELDNRMGALMGFPFLTIIFWGALALNHH